MSQPKPLRFAFVMDQQVGLKTQALNFERVLQDDFPGIDATFIPVNYAAEDPNPVLRAAEKALPQSIRGTLAGVREIRQAFASHAHFDAVLWATWAAKSVPELVKAVPSFLVMDMTPTQMETLGERYGYTKSRARFFGGWKRRATDRLYDAATHLFPWNNWVAGSLTDDYGVPANKITSVSPGTDTDLFVPDIAQKRSDGVTRLLFVGGDFERKGGDLLMRYLRERSASLPPVELHCATRDTVENAPANVHFYRGIQNNSPELVRLYQSCDLFVLPTRADCYSLVALEAMACGLPVVITDMGGIGDIVADGETGVLLLEKEDYAALSLTLNGLIAGDVKRETMGRAARDRATALFDCRKSVRTIVAAMGEASRK